MTTRPSWTPAKRLAGDPPQRPAVVHFESWAGHGVARVVILPGGGEKRAKVRLLEKMMLRPAGVILRVPWEALEERAAGEGD